MIEPKYKSAILHIFLAALIFLSQGATASKDVSNGSISLLNTDDEIPRIIADDITVNSKILVPLKSELTGGAKLVMTESSTLIVETALSTNLITHQKVMNDDPPAENLVVDGDVIFRVSLGHYNQLGPRGSMNIISGPYTGKFNSIKTELKFDTCEKLIVTEGTVSDSQYEVLFEVDTKDCESKSINKGTLTGVIICSIIFGFMLGFFILTFVSWRLRKSRKGTTKAAAMQNRKRGAGPKDKEDITENGEEDSVMQSDEEEAEDFEEDDDDDEFSSESSDDYDDDDDDGFSSSSESDYDTTSS